MERNVYSLRKENSAFLNDLVLFLVMRKRGEQRRGREGLHN